MQQEHKATPAIVTEAITVDMKIVATIQTTGIMVHTTTIVIAITAVIRRVLIVYALMHEAEVLAGFRVTDNLTHKHRLVGVIHAMFQIKTAGTTIETLAYLT